MKVHISQHLGFTLLEMLIALAIFSLVSITAGTLLYQAVDAQNVSTRLGDRLVDIERGLGRISRDVSQYIPRQVRDEFGDVNPALLVNEDSLEFTRRGWANPAEHSRSELQRVRFWVEEDALLRAYWDVLDRAPESVPRIQTIIDSVAWIAFEPITASEILTGEPPILADEEEEPPEGLRILLHVNGYGELIRVIDLPGQMPVGAGSAAETPVRNETHVSDEKPEEKEQDG